MFGGMSGKCLGDVVVMVGVVDVVDQDLGLSSRTFLTYSDLWCIVLRLNWTTGGRTPCSMPFTASFTQLGLSFPI